MSSLRLPDNLPPGHPGEYPSRLGSQNETITVMGNVNATFGFDFAGSIGSAYVNRFGSPGLW